MTATWLSRWRMALAESTPAPARAPASFASLPVATPATAVPRDAAAPRTPAPATEIGVHPIWSVCGPALELEMPLVMTDPNGRIEYASEAFATLSGYSVRDLIGETFGIIRSDAHPPMFFADLWFSLQQGRAWHGEICNRAKDGRMFWVDAIITPLREPGGAAPRGFVAVYHDISVARLAGQALAHNQTRIRSLLAMSTDWCWEQDAELRFTRFMGGPEGEDSITNRIGGLRRWELDVDLSDEGWAEHRATVQAHEPFRNFEYRVRNHRVPGEWLWFSVSGEPVYDIDGGFRGYRGISREIGVRRPGAERLWHMTHLDALTGLPNGEMFTERVDRAVRQGEARGTSFALVMIDVDHFRELNEAVGHEGGDQLLRSVASRVRSVVGESDLVARLGSDEFGVLLYDAGNPAAMRRQLDAVLAAMKEPFLLTGGAERHSTISMGVAIYPDDATVGVDLIRDADTALTRAKSGGRNRYDFFRNDMRSATQRRVAMCREMEAALNRDALLLYYQPVVDTLAPRVIGFEALLRWKHPTLGILTPGAFARAFDDPGLAARLGKKVMQMALTQAGIWIKAGVEFGRIAINVVAADFASERFAFDFAHLLQQYDVPPSRVAIEVTEGMFLGRSSSTTSVGLLALHDMGVEIAFDDFGTGYASLTHLKSLPIDRLKIDRSFIEGLTHDGTDASIVLAIVQLGKSLGKTVTAEGVETEQQITRLREMGCHTFQGYAFSRPMPADAVTDYLRHFDGKPKPVQPPQRPGLQRNTN